MMKKYSILIGVIIITFFSYCEKEITIDLPESEEKIVVEGWIEQGGCPIVLLTKNSPYFAAVDSASLVGLIVTDAKVTVSDGINSEVLFLSIYDYFLPFVYKGYSIKGEIGKTYSLTIEVEGKTLTASTTIPQLAPFDSVWFKLEPQKDTLGFLWAHLSDDPDADNFYRIFTKRINEDRTFIPILGSAYEDKFFNGQSFAFSIYRGIESFSDESEYENYHEMGYFKIGDTIVVKNCSIDEAHYKFWRTLEQEMFTGGSPFAAPTTIISNIQGGGLGVWGGYGVSLDTVIAQ